MIRIFLISIITIFFSSCDKSFHGSINLQNAYPYYQLSFFNYSIIGKETEAEAVINNIRYRGNIYFADERNKRYAVVNMRGEKDKNFVCYIKLKSRGKLRRGGQGFCQDENGRKLYDIFMNKAVERLDSVVGLDQ